MQGARDLDDVERLAKAEPDDYGAKQLLERIRGYRRAVAAGLDTGDKWRKAVADVAALGKAAPVVDPQVIAIKQAERALIGTTIPGYFPTPPAVVEQMMIAADLRPGERVLEPSAGKGDLAAAIRAEGIEPDVLELRTTLREILELKGFRLVGDDFLSFEPGPVYDTVIMNPPFEDLADVDHVRHAFEMLRPGGRVVAITSEAPFYHREKKAQDFRAFVESHGYSEKLPQGAFLDSDRPTGVATRLVVLNKERAG